MSLDQTFLAAFQAHKAAGDLFHGGAAAEAHAIFQTSTIGALLEGVYEGETSFAELARHGDFGLGTFNALDGEMTCLDGAFFQATADGRLSPVDPAMKTPFAVMIFFRPTLTLEVAEAMDFAGLSAALDGAVPSKNVFYAIKATGHFEALRLRAVRRQEKPYPPLVEAVADQPIFDHQEIDGSLLGFRFPDYAQGLNVPGYHLHFLSDDRHVGGHVFSFESARARIDIDVAAELHMALPQAGAFLSADLAKDGRDAIRKAEG